jgi:hypothetical protein
MLRAYYDGGAKGRHLTLAGLASGEAVWPKFERRWAKILRSHNLKWWHSADAMSIQPGTRRDFLIDPGLAWDRNKAEAAKADLRRLISSFHVALLDKRTLRSRFRILRCLIDLDHYREARARNPYLRSAYAICVNVCVGSLLPITSRGAHLFLDRGEKFLREIQPVWAVDRRKPAARWMRRLKSITPVTDWREVIPIQAADLVAWSVNDNPSRATEKGIARAHIFGRTHYYYDLEEIEKQYTRDSERERIEGERRNKRKTSLTRLLDQEEVATE